jgi:F-box/leucine-rich repeat protein 2/20
LAILKAVVQNAIEEHGRRISSDEWTVLKASSSKNKWVGRSKGLRELVKLSRVRCN